MSDKEITIKELVNLFDEVMKVTPINSKQYLSLCVYDKKKILAEAILSKYKVIERLKQSPT